MSGTPEKDPLPEIEEAARSSGKDCGDGGKSRRSKPKASAKGKGEGGQGSGGGKGGKGGGSKGGGGGGKGKGSKGGSNWDAAQLRNLDRPQLTLEDLQRVRPQRCVEAFSHLTVCSDWPEAGKSVPRSGSATWSGIPQGRTMKLAFAPHGRLMS